MTGSLERLEVGPVSRVLHHRVAVGQQNGVEVELLQRAPVLRRHRPAVAGDANRAHQPLVAGSDGRLQRPAGAERGLPLRRVNQVVQLDEIDVVDAEPFQRAVNLFAGGRGGALARLGGQEEGPAVARSIQSPSTSSARP